jgi:hypothetical protein
VKLLRRSEKEVVFHLGKREYSAFCRLLDRYPMVPADFSPLSRFVDPEDIGGDQQWLDESLNESKAESKKAIQDMLKDKKHFREISRGWNLHLTPGEVDWLLQIFGDIRVGCWMRLGCPDEMKGQMPALTADNLEYYVSMDMCGRLQMLLLHSLRLTGDAGI